MFMQVINGEGISDEEINDIVKEIIDILLKKNITYAIADMILNETQIQLKNLRLTNSFNKFLDWIRNNF